MKQKGGSQAGSDYPLGRMAGGMDGLIRRLDGGYSRFLLKSCRPASTQNPTFWLAKFYGRFRLLTSPHQVTAGLRAVQRYARHAPMVSFSQRFFWQPSSQARKI